MSALRAIVLGAAAGGGYPQWNCRCSVCDRAWEGDPIAAPRTQSSIAVSADGEHWIVLNASPDLRQQILQTPALYPAKAGRHSPIAAVVLTNADVDHIAGLLTLRERQAFSLYATAAVSEVLTENPIFRVLHPDSVTRHRLDLTQSFEPMGPEGPLGVRFTPFPVPGKVALFQEGATTPEIGVEGEATIGLTIEPAGGGMALHYIPGCAAMPTHLANRLRGADCVLFDGTLWRDDEMIAAEVGEKTGQRMGHMSMSGPQGSLAAFSELDVRRKIFIHINNTNPVLLGDSPERAEAEAAGWEIAWDGLEIALDA